MILFTFCTLSVIFFSYSISKMMFNRGNILTTSVLCIAVILSVTYILGFVFNAYNIFNITAVCVVLLVIAVCFYVFKLKNIKTVVLYERSFPLLKKHEKFIAVVIFLSVLFKLLSVFLLRVYDWDGLAYHIPNLVDYIQNQKIGLVEKSLWSNVYPRNMEMLNMWALVFRRDTLLIKLPQFIITLVGGAAVYEILKSCGVTVKNSFFGMMIYLSTPIVLAQMSVVYVDSMLASMIFICLYFIIEYIKRQSFALAFYIGLALGIIIGIKYSAAAYTMILALIFTVISFKSKKGWRNVVLAAAVAIPLGCVWYIFNLVNFGNPFEPFEINIGGLVLFKGTNISSSIMEQNIPDALKILNPIIRVLASWLEVFPFNLSLLAIIREFSVSYDERIGGFGINWLVFMFPSVFLTVFGMIKNKRFNYVLVLIITVPFLMFLITPEKWWVRYVLFFLIAGISAYVYLLDNNKIHKYIHAAFIAVMLINCAAGIMDDAYLIYDSLNNKNAVERLVKLDIKGFRSMQYPSKLARDVSVYINNDSYKIVSFMYLDKNELYFQGDNTQNIYKWYGPGIKDSPAIEGFNIVKYKIWFDFILDKEDPDFILLNEFFYEDYYIFFCEYNADEAYTLVYSDDGNLLFQKSKNGDLNDKKNNY